MTGHPAIAMNESGFTGDNLLDQAQPVYALAAVNLDLSTADEVVRRATSRCERAELKFSELRYAPTTRAVMFELFDELRLTPQNTRVTVAHKPWMVAAKMVELLIEPRWLARGRQAEWYVQNLHVDTAHLLFGRGSDALGDSWPDLQRAFVAMVRRFSPETATDFLRGLAKAREACTNPTIGLVLAAMTDTWEDLDDSISGTRDQLDPTPGCLFWQAGEWSSVMPDLTIVHDDSTVAERWAQYLITEEPSSTAGLRLGDIDIKLPHAVRGVSFVRSHDDARVQVADLVAGASAWFYADLAGLRPHEDLTIELEAHGIGPLLQWFVGPALTVA